MKNRILYATLGVALAAASLQQATPLRAQGWIEAGSVRRDRSTATAVIRNGVANVSVEEWFTNHGNAPAGEADYMFPMPAGAVFASYSLFQGDRELRGEVLDANAARRVYEEIVRRKKDPALIELAGRGLIRARVFPIAPGETRRVILRYTQPLVRAGDALEFRYTASRPDDSAPVAVKVNVEDGRAYRDAVSPTHRVVVRRDGDVMRVTPQGGVRGDFAMLLPLSRRDIGIAVSTHRDDATEDGFFMLRLSPGAVSTQSRVARDVTMVLDVSGSMSGEKLDQAKAALRQMLGTLGPRDRFRMIKFSGSSSEWREDWTHASRAEIQLANEWVEDLRADGGTNIGEALSDAFRVSTPTSRLGVVVFLTDGLPSVGEQDPERIAALEERSAGNTRVFAFGVGQDVNTYLLDRMGAAGRGGAQYVQPGESVETALGALSAKIQYPVLTDLALSVSGVTLREIYPTTLPDLFGGEDLVIFGRYRAATRVASTDRGVIAPGKSIEAEVSITGQRAGQTERYTTHVSFPLEEQGNDYMPRLWASRKLGELTRRVHLKGSDPEIMEEIRSTAMRYGLLSEYTSYFVAEPGVIATPSPALAQNAPPSAATGASAVAAAESARRLREVSSAGDLDASNKADALRVMADAKALGKGSTGGVPSTQVVAGRTFVSSNGVYVDRAIGNGHKTIDIALYSDAYFAVMAALPELKAYSGLEQFAVAGRTADIRLTNSGTTTRLTAADVAAIVKQFRGDGVRQ